MIEWYWLVVTTAFALLLGLLVGGMVGFFGATGVERWLQKGPPDAK